MAKYTLNREELAVIRYMSRHLYADDELIKCKFDIEKAKEVLVLEKEELKDILKRLEANYIVSREDDDTYIVAQSVIDAISKEDTAKGKEEKEIDDEETPLRLNCDATNYDKEIENEYEDVQIEFSDLRAEDPLNEDTTKESEETEEESECDETTEKNVKKRNKKKRLGYEDFNFNESIEVEDSSERRPVNKDIEVLSVPFRLNSDDYEKDEIDNAYKDQHIDFSDMRGGDLESITEGLRKNDNQLEDEHMSETNDGNLKSFVQFSVLSKETRVNKITKDGESVEISSVSEDNKGPITSQANGFIIEGGSFVKDTSLAEGFCSYSNENAYFGQNTASNFTSQSSVKVSMFRHETPADAERPSKNLHFDAVKRVNFEAHGNDQGDISPNKDGSVYGRTQDVEKNTELNMAIKEANVEMVKNFHTYDIAKLVRETGINELRSASIDVTSGIQGSYTEGMMLQITSIAGIGQAIAGKAAFSIDKYNQAMEDKAFHIAEKLSEKGTDINTLNKIDAPELKRVIENLGFTEKDADFFLRKADFIKKEFNYRQNVIKKAKTDSQFLSGDTELKEYLKNNGFKGLSAAKQIEILQELNLANKNAEIRNIDLRKLNRKQLETLLNKPNLDVKSRELLSKVNDLQGKKNIERFAGNHGFIRSMVRAVSFMKPSEQDYFLTSVKETHKNARTIYGRAVIRVTAVKVATDFAKKAYKSGRGFLRVGNAGFEKISSKSINEFRNSSKAIKTNTGKGAFGVVSNVLAAKSILSSAKNSLSDSLYQTESEFEEKQKKERKAELTNKISRVIDTERRTKKAAQKVANKVEIRVAKKTGPAMKNATKSGFKKAGSEAVKTTAKKTAKVTAKAASTGAKAGTTATAGSAAGATAAGTAGASAILVIAIVLIIIIIILFLLYMFDGFMMAGANGSESISMEMRTFGADFSEALSSGIKELEHKAILVSDKTTDNDEYIDIKDYLKIIQNFEEEREKNIKNYANARIGTYSPESMGLESYQMNGKYGQDAGIYAGHSTQYYGSNDKENGYTLHFIDANGNELANHSTNAKDVMALCAVMFSNQPDEDNVFPYLIEDQWYLMSPKIKWQESQIYCCDSCKGEYNGYDYSFTTCMGDNSNGKYSANGEIISYHCNDYSEVNRIRNLKNQGCKVEGDIRSYDSDGCKQREVSRYFYGDGYDTYDLYLDDYISYEDYRWYVDYYGDDTFSRRFYKYEWYCPGDHRAVVCYGHKDIDIYVTVYDMEYAEAYNLYPTESTSHTGKYLKYAEYLEDFLDTDKWKDEENVKWVDDLYNQDWYDIYGLDVLGGVGFNIGGSLSDADIDSILENLSEEELSVKQQAIIEFALKYVGKIPYYWGGKASSLNFESNKFGSTVEADYKGRTKKGLDCSGFVQWVMANNGIKVPGSTAGYSNYSTTKDHSQLKVGDLGLCNIPGSESNHIGIYAGKDESGNDLWVHCSGSSGSVVNNYNGFKYYISLGGI